MKKILVVCGIFICCAASFAMSLAGKSVVKTPVAATHKAPTSVTVTLTSNTGGNYRIIFNNSSYDHEFPMPNGSSQITVPAGTYTVAIVPATSGSNHNFSGVSCAVTYSASGTLAQFNNVNLTCGTASFSMN